MHAFRDKIVIGENGDLHDQGPAHLTQMMQDCADRDFVIGYVYWHGGPGGHESQLTEDLAPIDLYSVPQSFFTQDLRP